MNKNHNSPLAAAACEELIKVIEGHVMANLKNIPKLGDAGISQASETASNAGLSRSNDPEIIR